MVAGGVKDKDDSTHEWEEEITDQVLIFTIDDTQAPTLSSRFEGGADIPVCPPRVSF